MRFRPFRKMMNQSTSNKSLPPRGDAPVRTLKIEADGDFWKGLVIPKIRLMGHWLGRAGFTPGSRVQVTCVAPGVIELRSNAVPAVSEPSGLQSSAPRTASH